jgi:hypothetical protein
MSPTSAFSPNNHANAPIFTLTIFQPDRMFIVQEGQRMRYLVSILLVAVVVFSINGCWLTGEDKSLSPDAKQEEQPSQTAVIDDPIIITDTPGNDLFLDYNDLAEATVAGNELELTVRYSGGCKDHHFQVYMSPATFFESQPVQANIYIRHYANDDPCRAYITERLIVNIAEIKKLYAQSYGPHGEVVLNIKPHPLSQSAGIKASYTF